MSKQIWINDVALEIIESWRNRTGGSYSSAILAMDQAIRTQDNRYNLVDNAESCLRSAGLDIADLRVKLLLANVRKAVFQGIETVDILPEIPPLPDP